MTGPAAELYETDFYAWTQAQAVALRQLAKDHRNGPLDLENLAEEVEDLGSERLFGILSQLERLMLHLLKLEHSRSAEPWRGWLNSVDSARREIRRRLTPSIARRLPDELSDLYRAARRTTARELADYGEVESAQTLPQASPYEMQQLLDENWYPPNHHGLVDEL